MKDIALPHDHGEKSDIKRIGKMPDTEVFAKVADTFALISDSTRLKILWLLCHSEQCVSNIAAAIDMSAPAVSHHLRVLKQSEIVSSRKDGKETYYTLSGNNKAVLVHKAVDDIFDINCHK